MDIYKQKLTRLQNEILRILYINSGKELNQREIAKKLRVSPTAVSKSLNLLEKENLIVIKKQRNMNLNLVEFNTDNLEMIDMKRVDNLKMVYESKIIRFLEEIFTGCAIILFGSYSRGEDTIDSDIDIAVIGSKYKEIDLRKFENMLERKITINFYNSFKDIHKNLKSNILSGILLSGSIEL